MTGPGDVSPDVLGQLRAICAGLPEIIEEPAWIGVRWRVRTRTFAHLYTVDPERHHVYARTVGTREPVCVLTFRSPLDELEGLVGNGYPFFRAPWGADVVAMVLDENAEWDEVGELIAESYCVRAPKRLAALVNRP